MNPLDNNTYCSQKESSLNWWKFIKKMLCLQIIKFPNIHQLSFLFYPRCISAERYYIPQCELCTVKTSKNGANSRPVCVLCHWWETSLSGEAFLHCNQSNKWWSSRVHGQEYYCKKCHTFLCELGDLWCEVLILNTI